MPPTSVLAYASDEVIALKSELDRSVNFVRPTSDGGMLEARYVRRENSYFITYLSSHTGCRQACRFCHLTATGQTMMAPASLESYLEQADAVLAHYDSVREFEGDAGRVNFNFMARGEPLANPVVLDNFARLSEELATRATSRGLTPKFNISSILPKVSVDRDLAQMFAGAAGLTVLYYSLYSLDPAFRRRWLPTAMPGEAGLDRLAEYQARTGAPIVLHWAFIAGENDSEETVLAIVDAIKSRGLRAKFNLVRYNPYSPAQGEEPGEDVLERNFRLLADALGDPRSRIVPRVGFDVKASCGMFVEGAGAKRKSTTPGQG